jgi:lipid A 3-O-deacylase
MRAVGAIALLWASGNASAAQDMQKAQSPDLQSGWALSVAHENDLFNHGDDRDYSAGTLFSVTTPELAFAGHALAKKLPILNHYNAIGDFSLTQAIYTPRVLSANPPNASDRPYSGMLLGNLSGIAVSTDNSERDYLTFSLGVIGPSAGAEGAQSSVHHLIGGIAPQGWAHQIPDGIVGGVRLQRTNVFPLLEASVQRWSLQFEPEWSVDLGNVKTEAAVGSVVRWGRDAPNDLGVPRLEPATPGSGFFDPKGFFGWYLFAGLHEHFVAYDATLDRAPANNGPGVDKISWVTDLQGGLVVAIGNVRMSYTHELQTKEFKGQDRGDGFGALSLTYRFKR